MTPDELLAQQGIEQEGGTPQGGELNEGEPSGAQTYGGDLDAEALALAQKSFTSAGGEGGAQGGETEGGETEGGEPGGEGGEPGGEGGEPATFSERAAIESLFGKEATYQTFDEVKQSFGATNDQLKSLREANEALTGKVSSAINPFQSENIYMLNELAKKANTTDISLLSQIANADTETMDEKSALKLKYMLDHPTYAKRPDLVEAIIEKDFDLNNEDLEGTEKEINDLRFQEKGREAMEAIKTMRSEIPGMPNVENVQEQAVTELKQKSEQWKPVIDKIAEGSLKELTLDIGDEKTHKYVIEPEVASKYFQEALNYAAKNLPLTKESLPMVLEFAQARFLQDNWTKIFSSGVNQARSLEREKWDDVQQNPQGFNRQPTPQGGSGKPTEKALIDQIQEIEAN